MLKVDKMNNLSKNEALLFVKYLNRNLSKNSKFFFIIEEIKNPTDKNICWGICKKKKV